jgi:RNA polymerase-binding transcription factor DksA
MADEADIAGSETARDNVIFNDRMALIRVKAAHMPTGKQGVCKECGEHFQRLVQGHCGRCRDYLKIP